MRSCLVAPLFALLCPTIIAASDYHFVVRHIWNGHPTDAAYWISGDKSRTEHRSSYTDAKGNMTYGPRTAIIIDRGNRQIIELDLDDREYASQELRVGMTQAEIKRFREEAAKRPKPTIKRSPKVTIETNTVDTGERQIFFGHEARHFIRTQKTIRQDEPNAIDEQVKDGWYFDFHPMAEPAVARDSRKGNSVTILRPDGLLVGPVPQYELKQSGPELPGMPVKESVRFLWRSPMSDSTSQVGTHVTETEIVDFSEAPLDPALFQVPPGFKKVDRINTQPPLGFTDRVHFWWQQMKSDLSQLFH